MGGLKRDGGSGWMPVDLGSPMFSKLPAMTSWDIETYEDYQDKTWLGSAFKLDFEGSPDSFFVIRHCRKPWNRDETWEYWTAFFGFEEMAPDDVPYMSEPDLLSAYIDVSEGQWLDRNGTYDKEIKKKKLESAVLYELVEAVRPHLADDDVLKGVNSAEDAAMTMAMRNMLSKDNCLLMKRDAYKRAYELYSGYINRQGLYEEPYKECHLGDDPKAHAIFAIPARLVPVFARLGMFDDYDSVLVAPGATKKDLDALEKSGFNVAYSPRRKKQASAKLDAIKVKGSRATYAGDVSQDVKDRWFAETLVGSFWDANKDNKKPFGQKNIWDESGVCDGKWYSRMADMMFLGESESYKQLAELPSGLTTSILSGNPFDMRSPEYVSRPYGYYEFCTFDFMSEPKYAKAAEEAAQMPKMMELWSKALAAERKRSAFKRAADEDDFAKAEEIATDAGVKARMMALQAGVDIEDIVG